ncbi:hypothetical protein F0562_000148 [Nyssa sinensis]|uniref:Uncharacterized protein n=1 Tax=Nyssa sinensis TaxID=561372 RepID=A0A5J5C0P2_9ASTE|nr:hypothetical protein F0562_000148 [Nyssa sinensis]
MARPSNLRPHDIKADNLIISVNKEIHSIPRHLSEACIFKVHDALRDVNPEAYEPKLLAIGPYHCDKDKLMQEHKLRYLQLLLHRTCESSVDRYITAMRNLEEKARRCYGSPINIESDDFVKIMLLDGCFIIELFRKCSFGNLIDDDDPIFKMEWMRASITCDLILLENQLPFFVLVELFDMTKGLDREDNIIKLAQNFFRQRMAYPFVFKEFSRISDASHLLGLMHDCCCYSFADIVSNRNDGNGEVNFEFIKSVTELEEAGIEFKESKENSSFFNIKFENGVMEIPQLFIANGTEWILRNLIAYEQYRGNIYHRYVTDFAWFMDCLVNSAKDAEKLGQYGIINNCFGLDALHVALVFCCCFAQFAPGLSPCTPV